MKYLGEKTMPDPWTDSVLEPVLWKLSDEWPALLAPEQA